MNSSSTEMEWKNERSNAKSLIYQLIFGFFYLAESIVAAEVSMQKTERRKAERTESSHWSAISAEPRDNWSPGRPVQFVGREDKAFGCVWGWCTQGRGRGSEFGRAAASGGGKCLGRQTGLSTRGPDLPHRAPLHPRTSTDRRSLASTTCTQQTRVSAPGHPQPPSHPLPSPSSFDVLRCSRKTLSGDPHSQTIRRHQNKLLTKQAQHCSACTPYFTDLHRKQNCKLIKQRTVIRTKINAPTLQPGNSFYYWRK